VIKLCLTTYLFPVYLSELSYKVGNVRIINVAVEKAIIITYSVCLSVCGCLRMCRIILSSATCLVLYIFSHLINGTIFFEKGSEHKICVLIFFTTFVRKKILILK